MRDWERKPDKKFIDKKPLKLDKEIWEENRKIGKSCRYYWWKNLPTWTKDKEGKTKSDRERRDLVEERIGRNKVLFSS